MSYQFPVYDGESQLGDYINPSSDLIDINQIKRHQDLPDGSSVFVVGETAGDADELPADNDGYNDFYANLAEQLDDSTLNSICNDLLDKIKDDRESRREWEKACNLAIKYLGWKLEDFKDTNANSAWKCGAFDTTLSTTLMNFIAMAKPELFPPEGPAKSMIEGYATQEIEDRGERSKMFINYFLTVLDKSYYSDSDRLLMYVGLFGSAFRKVVMDPISGMPSLRLVKPQNLIINNHTTSLLESTRITEEIFLTRKEVLLKQRDGIYREDSLPINADENNDIESTTDKTIKKVEGIQDSASENKTLFKFYESHTELDPLEIKDIYGTPKERNNIPRPYIVTICEATRKIVSIIRNWEENNDKFKREECYAHYYYLPGLGIYSCGLAHIQGSNAIALTSILRQLIDKGSLSNFPGGMIQKQAMKSDKNNIVPGPGEFIEVDTGGIPLNQFVMTMPYGEPSMGLLQLQKDVKGDTLTSGGASMQGHDVINSNTPVGTMLAQVEAQNRIPSTILRSLYSSLSHELQLLKKLFAKYLPDGAYPFNVPGNHMHIMKEDFSDEVNIIPVADPNIITTTQRVIINEILVKIAKENPTLFDLRECYTRLLQSMRVPGIEKIMQPQQQIAPQDPISENMSVITGKGIKAGIEQDHESHILTHTLVLQQLAQDPMKQGEAAIMKAHIAEHQALLYLVKMQQAMGFPMPNPQMLQDPQVQNQIAMMAAQATQQIQAEQQAQNPPPLDANAVLMQEIEQKREASHLKHEEAQLRAETEAFKAQTKFESDKVKMDVEKELARDKNETDLTIAKMKQPNNSE